MSELIQAHSTPVVNLVASQPLEGPHGNAPSVLGGRQRLVSLGEDGEVRVWAVVQLLTQDHDHPTVDDLRLRHVTLQLLFSVCTLLVTTLPYRR